MKLPRIATFFLVILFSFLIFKPPITQALTDEEIAQEAAAADNVLKQTHKNYTKKWATPIKQMQKTRDESDGYELEKFSHTTALFGAYFLQEAIFGAETEGEDPSVKNLQSQGAIHIAGNYIAQVVSQPPTSSVEYLADLGRQINPVTSAYAQEGIGYQGLSGVLEVWKGFRDISYALFVVIFVVVGFMIMFRAKLNPQTVVNLQLALPKLIITLILITFSYAIAGLVIDLVYFIIYLAVNLFNSFGMTDYSSGKEFLDQPFADLINFFEPNNIAKSFADSLENLFPPGAITDILTGNIISTTLVKLITGGAILFSILKLLLQLVLAYVNIILQVIFAPIILLFNALPQSNSFSSWIKNLAANAAAFPATAIIILVGSSLTSSSGASVESFTPPFLSSLPGLTNFSQSVIGLGTILLLPKVVSMIQEALKAKSALPVGAAVAEGAAAGTAPIRSYLAARKERKRMEQQAELYKQAQNT